VNGYWIIEGMVVGVPVVSAGCVAGAVLSPADGLEATEITVRPIARMSRTGPSFPDREKLASFR